MQIEIQRDLGKSSTSSRRMDVELEEELFHFGEDTREVLGGLLLTPKNLARVASTEEGRALIRSEVFDDKGKVVINGSCPWYNICALHHLYKGQTLWKNGKELVYTLGRDGRSYYYAGKGPHLDRVRFRTGDVITTCPPTSKPTSTLALSSLTIEKIASTEEGRARIRKEVLTRDDKVEHPLSSSQAFQIHHLFQGEKILVNGRPAVYKEGKEGKTYYYEDDEKCTRRVRFSDGATIVSADAYKLAQTAKSGESSGENFEYEPLDPTAPVFTFPKGTRQRRGDSFGMRFHPIDRRWKMHEGVDIVAGLGVPLLATSDATVSENKSDSKIYGNSISLTLPGGEVARFAHLKEKSPLKVGQKIKKGSVVGLIGSTGKSSGPHLHFEIRKGGQAVNPDAYLVEDLRALLSDEISGEDLNQAKWAEVKASVEKLKTRFNLRAGELAIVVDPEHQRLYLIRDDRILRTYPVSTAKAGIGAEVDSEQTPPGTHRIRGKFGAGAQEGTLFEGRAAMGRKAKIIPGKNIVASGGMTSRVMLLQGQEKGINMGSTVGSLGRQISIHGTPKEASLGKPASHGCIRMGNRDVIDLFERIREGTLVEIQAKDFRSKTLNKTSTSVGTGVDLKDASDVSNLRTDLRKSLARFFGFMDN